MFSFISAKEIFDLIEFVVNLMQERVSWLIIIAVIVVYLLLMGLKHFWKKKNKNDAEVSYLNSEPLTVAQSILLILVILVCILDFIALISNAARYL